MQPARLGRRVNPAPVNLDAGGPYAANASRMTVSSEDLRRAASSQKQWIRLAIPDVSSDERRQGFARAELEEDRSSHVQNLLQALREPNRPPQVLRPVGRSIALAGVIHVPVTFET